MSLSDMFGASIGNPIQTSASPVQLQGSGGATGTTPLQGPSLASGFGPQQGSAPGGQSILGMSPDQFSAMAGGIGSTLSKKGSWQDKLGTLARGIGLGQIGMAANKIKAAADQKAITDLMAQDPGFAAKAAASIGTPAAPLNPDIPAAPANNPRQTGV